MRVPRVHAGNDSSQWLALKIAVESTQQSHQVKRFACDHLASHVCSQILHPCLSDLSFWHTVGDLYVKNTFRIRNLMFGAALESATTSSLLLLLSNRLGAVGSWVSDWGSFLGTLVLYIEGTETLCIFNCKYCKLKSEYRRNWFLLHIHTRRTFGNEDLSILFWCIYKCPYYLSSVDFRQILIQVLFWSRIICIQSPFRNLNFISILSDTDISPFNTELSDWMTRYNLFGWFKSERDLVMCFHRFRDIKRCICGWSSGGLLLKRQVLDSSWPWLWIGSCIWLTMPCLRLNVIRRLSGFVQFDFRDREHSVASVVRLYPLYLSQTSGFSYLFDLPET